MNFKILLMLIVAWIAATSNLRGQQCPENIDFENGNFKNWKIYTGLVTEISLDLAPVSAEIFGRHTIISDKNAIDLYGQFSIIPKNSGGNVVKLGNDGTGGQADAISYLINVPTNKPEYSITYQYAVVLEDPMHVTPEQPRFIVRVRDVLTNEYLPCASFQYIATSDLPGFKKSPTDPIVIYKDWSAVTLNLSGYQGKQLELEFITTDCTLGGHFGYAYVDVSGICGDMILGATYCKSSEQIAILGPSGYKSYTWYNEDRTINYGSGQSLTIKPTPAEGSKLLLDLVPYTGFGCSNTVVTVIKSVDYKLELPPKFTVCEGTVIDPSAEEFILNRHPDFTYYVYEDKDLTIPVNGPFSVTQNKTYYVQATNNRGCVSVASIDISLYPLANVKINHPPKVCYTETVDITKNELYSGDYTNTNRSYYTNAEATNVLQNPTAVNLSGKYYVKFLSDLGCVKILPIDVTISERPVLKIINPALVCYPSTVDITDVKLYAGSDSDLKLSYYLDESLSQEIINPKAISTAGTYYIKAINNFGCIEKGRIRVDFNEQPMLSVKNPDTVCYPSTVDITNAQLYQGTTHAVKFEYFKDSNLSNKLNQPWQVTQSGTYYVKITNENGCSVSDKIIVSINNMPTIVLNKPKPIFDNAYIDLTNPEITKGSKDFVKIKYYENESLTTPVLQPEKVNKAGTYYIMLENENSCSVSAALTLNILSSPKILVPTAFTPQKSTNNRLYPFFTSIQKLGSFKVYNKWGLLVYQTNDMSTDGWDGQVKSRMQPLETYSWFADGVDVLGNKFQTKGKTVLIL
ncbi:gliding motility-associated C-terminal domain-containing protein [Pedobacter sp. Leaf170]|uniref:gliding motility-associated C-terminal domain-containing protein n=1 Tax=Pedobacter sp. Leaf170 TaxID=2876558 RepID=UPI001E4B60C0|nr:gliding motility-associated C-terminal domain-containing protein [Pedobacter sp. Leaf170]